MPLYLNGETDDFTPASLGEIGDVDLTGLLVGQGISWDGSNWVPTSFALASDLGDYVLKAGDTMTGALFMDNDAPIKIGEDGDTSAAAYEQWATGSGQLSFASYQGGDTGARVGLFSDASVRWGSGTGAPGIQLKRQANGRMRMIGADFEVGSLWRIENGTGLLGFGSNFISMQDNAGANNAVFLSGQAANVWTEFSINADGALQWGGGTASRDVRLERVSANLLGLGDGDSLRLLNGDLQVDDGSVLFDEANIVSDWIVRSKLASDGDYRFGIRANGELEWDDGLGGGPISEIIPQSFGLQVSGRFQVPQAPLAPNDVARKADLDAAIDAEVFGDGYMFDKNAVLATTSLSTPIEGARVDLTGLDAGDYLVMAHCHFTTSNSNSLIKMQIAQDPDGAATEIDGEVTNRSAPGTTAIVNFMAQVTLPAGSESFAVRFWHDAGAGSSTLEESTIYAHRVA